MAYEFELKILKASESKQAALLNPDKTAANKPDTGVKILKKHAYFVIRDCARVTERYLIHYIWGDLKNPIERLEGVFTKSEIESFITRSKRDPETGQLCTIILKDIEKKNKLEASGIPAPVVEKEVIDFTEYDDEKIYGDYDMLGDVVDVPTVDNTKVEKTVLELFLEAFKPKT